MLLIGSTERRKKMTIQRRTTLCILSYAIADDVQQSGFSVHQYTPNGIDMKYSSVLNVTQTGVSVFEMFCTRYPFSFSIASLSSVDDVMTPYFFYCLLPCVDFCEF